MVRFRRSGAGVLLAALALSSSLSACGGPERTPEAFCEVMDLHRERFEDATGNALTLAERGDAAGLLGGTAQMVSALGDLQVMFDELAEVAPDDIRADAKRVRDTNRDMLESAEEAVNDPVGALVGGLAGGLINSGSYTRLNDYAGEHCGSRPF